MKWIKTFNEAVSNPPPTEILEIFKDFAEDNDIYEDEEDNMGYGSVYKFTVTNWNVGYLSSKKSFGNEVNFWISIYTYDGIVGVSEEKISNIKKDIEDLSNRLSSMGYKCEIDTNPNVWNNDPIKRIVLKINF